GGIEGDLGFHARWELRGEPVELRHDAAFDVERVRCRELNDAEPTRFASLQLELGAIGLGSERCPPYVFQTDERAIRTALRDHVLELRGLAKPTKRAHAELIHLP